MINVVSEENPIFETGMVNVWQHVAKTKPHLIESMSNIKLNNDTVRKIYARKCNIIELESKDAREFLNQCHAKGFAASTFYYGLEYNDEIVMVMSFAPSRYSKNYTYEVIRLASTLNTIVVGGASKLLNHFIKSVGSKSIFTYSENMLGSGAVYENLGFKNVGKTKPGYFWFKDGEVVSRYMTKKHLIQQKFPHLTDEEVESKSETAIMCGMGYIKVSDMGNTIWGMEENVSEFKYHYLYKITRPTIDESFYIGVHSTDDLDDGYMGSGNRIGRSIDKHGMEVHTKEIISFFDTRDALLQAEADIVNEELLKNPNCMNLICGGIGGFGRSTTTGKIVMSKPQATWFCYVDSSDIEQFQQMGFEIGSAHSKGGKGTFYTLPGDSKIYRSLTPPENHIPYIKQSTKDYKWIVRDGKRKLVPTEHILETDILSPELCATVKNMVQMMRGDERRFIPIDEADEYIANGYEVKSFTKPKLGKVEICKDGEKTIAVSEEEAIHKIKNEGWSLKRKQLKSAPEPVINVAKALGMRIPKTKLGDDGYINPPKPKQRSSSTGKIAVRKDGIKRMVSEDEAKNLVLNDGWELGAASAWDKSSEKARKLGEELGYDVKNKQTKLHK